MTPSEGECSVSIRLGVVARFDPISDARGFGRVGLPIDRLTKWVLHSRHGKLPIDGSTRIPPNTAAVVDRMVLVKLRARNLGEVGGSVVDECCPDENLLRDLK